VEAVLSVPIYTNQFTHFACTYANGVMTTYTNGELAGTVTTTVQPIKDLVPAQQPGIGIGNIGDSVNNFPYFGLIDEITAYNQPLTQTQVEDVYAAGSAGKCPVIGGGCLVSANIILDATTNIAAASDTWVTNVYHFTAPTNGTFLEIQPRQDGMLVDSIQLVESPGPNAADFFLPEESLDKVVGENAKGNWTLEVLDNRAGATNPQPLLVSWQLTLTLDTVVPSAIPLTHAIPQTNSVNPFEIRYFRVDVPAWARFATNTLFNVSGGVVNLLFNQNILPTGTGANDFTLLNSSGGGVVTLSTSGTVPTMQSGQQYYLGVQNLGAGTVNFSIEVDFDITTLTNGVPLTNTLAAVGLPHYYQYDVSSNAIAVAFEILRPNGNVDLFAHKGPPLPDELNFDYVSARPGTNNEAIVVITNSTPVPLTPGRWYLGVFNNDVAPVTYIIRATESGPPTIIPLTNAIPFNFHAGPGVLQTNFFSFVIDQTNPAALFELYNLTGNADLDLQRGSLPYLPPFFATSSRPGTNYEQIVIRTNLLGTNINATWYLSTPNNDPNLVNYTIRAILPTNGILISAIPITVSVNVPPPGSTNGPTLIWPSVEGEAYAILVTSNFITWTTNAIITNAPVPTATYVDPTPVTGFPWLFYRIEQIAAP
jgi:hypothetical protein